MKKRLLVIAIVLVGLAATVKFWFAIQKATSPANLEWFRNLLLSTLQIVALGGVLFILFVILRWVFRKREGTVILPFDCPKPEKTDKTDNNYNGKAISDSLKTELLRIYQIHQQENEDVTETLSNRVTELFARINRLFKSLESEVDQVGSVQFDGNDSIRLTGGKRGEIPNLPATSRPSERFRFNTISNPTGDNLNPGLADVATVGVGGATVSVGRVLITIKQLWALRDPSFVISGSLQRFGSVVKLVAFRDGHGEQIDAWEVSSSIKNEDEIPDLVKDLAFKIWQGISAKDKSTPSSAKTWEGFKHFTEALDGYRRYTVSDRDDELERTYANTLEATKAESKYKATFELLYSMASKYLEKSEFARVEELCTKAIEVKDDGKPDDTTAQALSDAYNLLGVAQANLGQTQAAEFAFRRAIKRNPNNLEPYINLSYTLSSQLFSQEAKAIVEKAVKQDLVDPSKTILGDWYASLYLPDEAMAAYKKDLEKNPSDAYSLYRLGGLHSDAGQNEEAIKQLEMAMTLSDKNLLETEKRALIRNELAVAYANNGDAEKAVKLYQEAVELDPEFAFPHHNLGLFYANEGRLDEAQAEYLRAIALQPDMAAAYLNLGGLYATQGFRDEAIGLYETAVKVSPEDAESHLWLGLAYAERGQSQEAINELNEAIKFNPEDFNAHNALGYVYRNLGEYKKAIDAFNLSLKFNLDFADSYIGLGGVYRRMGSYADSIPAYEEALKRDEANPLARGSLAASYRKLGRQAEADEQVKIALATEYDWEGNLYNQACFCALCGLVDDALTLLEQALDLGQQSRSYASGDSDFEDIRDDPRFQAVVKEEASAAAAS